ncbi:hypothetical protein K466DRAFT_333359 [Polyporus arcularius HHB13444]|uniref:Uncharacterized protein n=1 Tax=Polyporus arcularius HHB13444 TaxID=1314778 RepID=A0A5C3PPL8_9APHY|nr:hypothetical protein K466DRAFT_333359 [Polyporus arcularius HHB13444]
MKWEAGCNCTALCYHTSTTPMLCYHTSTAPTLHDHTAPARTMCCHTLPRPTSALRAPSFLVSDSSVPSDIPRFGDGWPTRRLALTLFTQLRQHPVQACYTI